MAVQSTPDCAGPHLMGHLNPDAAAAAATAAAAAAAGEVCLQSLPWPDQGPDMYNLSALPTGPQQASAAAAAGYLAGLAGGTPEPVQMRLRQVLAWPVLGNCPATHKGHQTAVERPAAKHSAAGRPPGLRKPAIGSPEWGVPAGRIQEEAHSEWGPLWGLVHSALHAAGLQTSAGWGADTRAGDLGSLPGSCQPGVADGCGQQVVGGLWVGGWQEDSNWRKVQSGSGLSAVL